jgi:transposase
MSTSKQRNPVKERFWRRTVRQWQKSGLSVRAFCSQEGLSEPSLYAWRRTLKQRDAEAMALVPVRVVSEPEPAAADPADAVGLELVLGGGRRVRIGPTFDPVTLQRLLRVLEEGQP